MRDARFRHHALRSASKCTPALILFAVVVSCSGDSITGGENGDGTPPPVESPANASPVANDDLDVARSDRVTLDASASTDPDDDPLEYVWRQIHGPDVTGPGDTLTGVAPVFTAPNRVSTVLFELAADDGHGLSEERDTVQINVMENPEHAIFVDGDAGSDADGDGSRTRPYATISGAINHVSGPDQDIYVMTRAGGARYDETAATLAPPTTISLYGGYDRTWVRDVVNNRTGLDGASKAVVMGLVSADAWFSGFDVHAAAPAGTGASVFGVSADSGTASATLYVEDNRIATGDAAGGDEGVEAGSAYALWLANLGHVQVRRNVLEPGAGGTGGNGGDGRDGGDAGSNGGDGANPTSGAGGSGALTPLNGGRGGDGGSNVTGNGDGEPGEGTGGGAGGSGNPVGSGGDGQGGAGGRGGNGGQGGGGAGALQGNSTFQPDNGLTGSQAGHGVGGGGGGGGGADGVGLDGGGGGGGGGASEGGVGGTGGGGGGASIGLLLDDVVDALVEANTIVTADGGRGGNGGAGGTGGKGSDGGVGGPGKCSFLGCNSGQSGDGGEGGGGGGGGIGGQGGGGGGGPSYGILVGHGISPTIRMNTITVGDGGNGGTGGAAGLGGSKGGDGSSTGGSGGCCTFHTANAGTPGTGGEGGWSYGIFDADPADGALPVVESNTITAGMPGSGAAISGATGQAGERNF